MQQDKPNVFIVCTGVGHINRGYESFTKECFTALKDDKNFTLYLAKGGGKPADQEIKVSCIKRNSSLASFLSRITKKQVYWIEQASFIIGLLPSLIRYKPAVIFYSDFILGTFLWHIRKLFKFKYQLLFSNGAPNKPPFTRMDHVQQLLPVYMNEAIQLGAPAATQTLLPYGFQIDITSRLENINRKADTRKALGFTNDQKIILSVGAINKHHKRMDYIIKEMAKMPDDFFLVILGQFEEETPALVELAAGLIPGRYRISNVPYEEVKNYYIAADYFVLASLSEGFGRVLVEAISFGLPCIVHDYETVRQVLGEDGKYTDLRTEGALHTLLIGNMPVVNREQLIHNAYNRYSWDVLAKGYSAMISTMLNKEQ